MSYRSSSEHQHHRNKAFSGESGGGSHHSFDRDSGDDWNGTGKNGITARTSHIQLDHKPTDRSYDSEPRKTLFIGRLSPNTTEGDLRKFFDRFGEIRSLHLIRDILTGDSRRYAFLEYSRSKEADAAYAEGNNATLDGRRILVDREHGRVEKTSVKTLRRPNHQRGSFGNGGGGPMRHSFGGGRNFGNGGNDYSLSKIPNERSRPSLHFNGGGRGGSNSGTSHYHPYSGGARSSNGNGSSYINGGGGGSRITSSSSSSFSRSGNHHHHHHSHHRKNDEDDDFDQSIRSRMHGSNSGGYGSYHRR